MEVESEMELDEWDEEGSGGSHAVRFLLSTACASHPLASEDRRALRRTLRLIPNSPDTSTINRSDASPSSSWNDDGYPGWLESDRGEAVPQHVALFRLHFPGLRGFFTELALFRQQKLSLSEAVSKALRNWINALAYLRIAELRAASDCGWCSRAGAPFCAVVPEGVWPAGAKQHRGSRSQRCLLERTFCSAAPTPQRIATLLINSRGQLRLTRDTDDRRGEMAMLEAYRLTVWQAGHRIGLNALVNTINVVLHTHGLPHPHQHRQQQQQQRRDDRRRWERALEERFDELLASISSTTPSAARASSARATREEREAVGELTRVHAAIFGADSADLAMQAIQSLLPPASALAAGASECPRGWLVSEAVGMHAEYAPEAYTSNRAERVLVRREHAQAEAWLQSWIHSRRHHHPHHHHIQEQQGQGYDQDEHGYEAGSEAQDDAARSSPEVLAGLAGSTNPSSPHSPTNTAGRARRRGWEDLDDSDEDEMGGEPIVLLRPRRRRRLASTPDPRHDRTEVEDALSPVGFTHPTPPSSPDHRHYDLDRDQPREGSDVLVEPLQRPRLGSTSDHDQHDLDQDDAGEGPNALVPPVERRHLDSDAHQRRHDHDHVEEDEAAIALVRPVQGPRSARTRDDELADDVEAVDVGFDCAGQDATTEEEVRTVPSGSSWRAAVARGWVAVSVVGAAVGVGYWLGQHGAHAHYHATLRHLARRHLLPHP